MFNYYKQIKYIVQDSFYESCSNVKIEGLFNGCKMRPVFVISSTQYPGYGGAATNAYKLIKYIRSKGYKAAGLFFNNDINVNYDPDKIGGIFINIINIVKSFEYNKFDKNNIIKYLNSEPNICLAKNYHAPILCKKIFNCYTVYLVSGINHFSIFYNNISAIDLLNSKIDDTKIIKDEIECTNLVDLIIFNSKLCMDLFKKLYKKYNYNKYYNDIIDTTINIDDEKILKDKEYDLVICSSVLTRTDKNNIFLINILKNKIFDNYKKCIIGNDNILFKNIPNSDVFNLLPHKKCIELMSSSRIILYPSLNDANPNTLREAVINNCIPLITRNIGFNELYPDYCICDNFTDKEWTAKILYLLENYNTIINNFKIDYDSDSINKLLTL
jgi:glycosyltransferase involved in cell wall biosynthesis